MATNVVSILDHRGAPMARHDAGSVSRRTAGWNVSRGTGPNREIASDLSLIIDRSRDLARNNPWARRAIAAIVNNWIGSGIRAQWKGRRQKRWTAWFESTDIDADGRLDGYGIQQLVARTAVESGAALVRKRPRRTTDGFAIPLQIQVLEPDWIDRSKNELTEGGGYIVQGIQFDALGRRVAYWLYPEHPGDATHRYSMISQPKPASEFMHVYRLDRPGQVHGMPWGIGAYTRLRMLDDIHDAILERQRQSACYMAFVRDLDSGVESATSANSLVEKFEPGLIEILPPGKNIEFAEPPAPPNSREFELSVLLSVASDYGIPYEVMTGDLSKVNFSSARMGFQEFGRSIESWRWQLFAPQFLNPLAQWYLEAENIAGYTARPELPLWTAPARQIVDPAREIPAIKEAMRIGIKSIPQGIREQGFDPEIVARENAEYFKLLDGLGLALDSDARHAPNGPAAAPVEPAKDEDIEEDDDA